MGSVFYLQRYLATLGCLIHLIILLFSFSAKAGIFRFRILSGTGTANY